MADVLKLIPWLQEYPTWLQTAVAFWMGLTALLGILLLLTPRTSPSPGSQPSSTVGANRDSASSTQTTTIEQTTKGDNSPAVGGIEGNVDIKIEQRSQGEQKK
jgi:hypothetical protein